MFSTLEKLITYGKLSL